MNKNVTFALRFGAALVWLLTPPRMFLAQESTLQLDPARTEVGFTLGATLHTVEGFFKLKSGTIRFNPDTGAASGTIVVDATSAQTGNAGRDRNMHQKVLESQRYPEIVWTVDGFTGRVAAHGKSDLDVHGKLSLHGSEHEMTARVSLETEGDQATTTARFTIPYVAWGLKNPSTLFLRVADKVELDVRAVGRLTRAPN